MWGACDGVYQLLNIHSFNIREATLLLDYSSLNNWNEDTYKKIKHLHQTENDITYLSLVIKKIYVLR